MPDCLHARADVQMGNSMPLARQPGASPYTSGSPYPPGGTPQRDRGGYDNRDEGEKGFNNINEKLEQLQMRIKHAQTEEEADR